MSYLLAGGPIIGPIILLSFCMWGLIIERSLALRTLEKQDISMHEFLVLENRSGPGLRSQVLAQFLKERTYDVELDCRVLDRAVMRVRPMLNLHLPLIGVLAAIAPLLGLLGTVGGMVATFDVISIFGTGNAKGLAGGISMALITTQTGLMVAIPGLYMSVYLHRHARRLETGLDEAVLCLKRSIRGAL